MKGRAFKLEHTRELAGTDNERGRCSLLLCSFIIIFEAKMKGKSGEGMRGMEEIERALTKFLTSSD